ncbi:hypothetical protein GCM10025862_05400 [Arsenicicoccus piscis]|uniref:Zn-dependent oxidoreductase n=1 Tax=Arsenicicoccus piscis TaxID=673954 RepID=A0ABQ6HJ19_9MICO|nr:hypothetical protein GCM10025862_05400 [Arsenicicoccus piscis]
MLACFAASQSADNPLSGLQIGEQPAPVAEDGWTVVTVRTAGLNHHDLWSLKGWVCPPTGYR